MQSTEIAPEAAPASRPDAARWDALAPWIALALIVIYFVGVALMAPHRPFGDDIDIAREAAAFGQAKTPEKAWFILEAQHNEHRPVLVRLVFWAVAALPGDTSYTLIALMGGLFLVLAWWLLVREGRKDRAPAMLLVVLAALMFNFGSAESSLWAMAAISNFGVLAMLVAMLALLQLDVRWAWTGFIPAVLAAGLQGNGVLVPLVGALYLLFNGKWLAGTLLMALSAAIVAWFLTDYIRPMGGLDLTKASSRLAEILTYVLAFCGSAAAFGGKSLGSLNLIFVSVAAVLGASMVAATAWGAIRGDLWRGRIALWINLFIILTGFAAALSRLDNGVQQALASRYHVNSCLMIASTLIWLLGDNQLAISRALRKRMGAIAIASVVYFAATGPILIWMHNLYAPKDAMPPGASESLTPNGAWNFDKASLASAEG